MINQKDIDSAIRYGTERNIDKEAKELTERYLLNKLGEYIALKKNPKKVSTQTPTRTFSQSP